jgi:hypothetical protein
VPLFLPSLLPVQENSMNPNFTVAAQARLAFVISNYYFPRRVAFVSGPMKLYSTHPRHLNRNPQSFLHDQRQTAFDFAPPSRVKIASRASYQVACSEHLGQRIGHFFHSPRGKDGKVSGMTLVRRDVSCWPYGAVRRWRRLMGATALGWVSGHHFGVVLCNCKLLVCPSNFRVVMSRLASYDLGSSRRLHQSTCRSRYAYAFVQLRPARYQTHTQLELAVQHFASD